MDAILICSADTTDSFSIDAAIRPPFANRFDFLKIPILKNFPSRILAEYLTETVLIKIIDKLNDNL